jgi:deferrochelatase/peroxidase EfeB
MALAKGVRPDPVVSNPRANAALVFVSLRSDMGSEELKAWLQTVSGKVTELTALHRGEKNASVAVGFGPSFFGAPGAPRFDIPAERVPAGFAELPVLPGDVAAARDVVFYVMATHEDALAQFLRDLSATRPAISGITIERGFQRADRRELGGFLDGLRNVRSDRRHGAIFVGRDRLPEEPWWTEDGTYLAYLKVQQNLDAWAQRSGEDHQQIMGRFKARPGSRLDQPGVSPHAEPGFAGDVPHPQGGPARQRAPGQGGDLPARRAIPDAARGRQPGRRAAVRELPGIACGL